MRKWQGLLLLLVFVLPSILQASSRLNNQSLLNRFIPYLEVQYGKGGMITPTETDNGYLYGAYGPEKTKNKVQGNTYAVDAGLLFHANNVLDFGLEIDYNKYPNNTYSFPSQKSWVPGAPPAGTYHTAYAYSDKSVSVLAVVQFNIYENVYGILKGGVAFVNQTLTVEADKDYDSSNAETLKRTDNQSEAAIGIGYQITPNFDITTTYSGTTGHEPEWVFGREDNKQRANVAPTSSFMLGLTLKM